MKRLLLAAVLLVTCASLALASNRVSLKYISPKNGDLINPESATFSWTFQSWDEVKSVTFVLLKTGFWPAHEETFTGNAAKNGKVTVKNLESNLPYAWRLKVVTTAEEGYFGNFNVMTTK